MRIEIFQQIKFDFFTFSYCFVINLTSFNWSNMFFRRLQDSDLYFWECSWYFNARCFTDVIGKLAVAVPIIPVVCISHLQNEHHQIIYSFPNYYAIRNISHVCQIWHEERNFLQIFVRYWFKDLFRNSPLSLYIEWRPSIAGDDNHQAGLVPNRTIAQWC